MVIELEEPGRTPRRKPNAMACPVCDVPLSMADRQGIEIDYCPTCRGVWLDRGELDKIIERSLSEMAPPRPKAPPPRDHRDQDYDEDDYKRSKRHSGGSKHGYRRKSWLHELFD